MLLMASTSLTDLVGPANVILTAVLGLLVMIYFLINEINKLRRKKLKCTHPCEEISSTDVEGSKADCTIIFGTQTGTAEKFAKTLKSQLESAYGATTSFHVVDAEKYDAKERLLKEKFVVFLVATYGDGEPTDSAVDLQEYLQEASENVDCADLPMKDSTFAVFGLGNRQYEHFCAMGKKVHKAMTALGSTPLVKLGMGDDDDDIDRDFDEWSEIFFKALQASSVLERGTTEDITIESVPSYCIEEIVDAPSDAVNCIKDGCGTNVHNPHLATVMTVRELHGETSDRSCVHVELDISGSDAAYETGDHIGVFPMNEPRVVSEAADLLGKSLNMCFNMIGDPSNEDLSPPPIDGPMTLKFALTNFADLLSAPSKASLKMLSAFATDQEEHDKLVKLSSLDGKDLYDEYIHLPKRSLLEVLKDFPSAKPSIGAFFGSIAPRLQPRYYSISSSHKLHPKSVHITCAVVKETMPTGRVHNGVASTWLAGLKQGDKVPIYLRRSSFKLPEDPKAEIIMIGPGTGLAPFRGFIQDREADMASGRQVGPATLYFGCRNKLQDYIYAEELNKAVKNGSLSKLHVAFSREGPKKNYVQHHVEKNSATFWEALSNEGAAGYLYICGDGKHMAKDVHQTLVKIVMDRKGCSSESADAIVRDLAENGRYHKDVW